MPQTLITERAIATLTIPGSADFIVAERRRGVGSPIADASKKARAAISRRRSERPVPRPCGVPAIGFGAVWVVTAPPIRCIDRSSVRERVGARSTRRIREARGNASPPTTLADGRSIRYSDRSVQLATHTAPNPMPVRRTVAAPATLATGAG